MHQAESVGCWGAHHGLRPVGEEEAGQGALGLRGSRPAGNDWLGLVTAATHVAGQCGHRAARPGELLLLFEAKQGCGSGKTEAAAARLGAGDKDPGEDGVLWRGGDGLGLQERRGLSDELLLLDAARGRRGRREDREESPGAEVVGAWRGSGRRGQLVLVGEVAGRRGLAQGRSRSLAVEAVTRPGFG